MVGCEREIDIENKKGNFIRPFTEKIKRSLSWVGAGITGAACMEAAGVSAMYIASKFYTVSLDESMSAIPHVGFALAGCIFGLVALDTYKFEMINRLNEENKIRAADYFRNK